MEQNVQSTNLPGVIEFTTNSNGNKPLENSPYGYEMWTQGGNKNKLIWFGPEQRGGAAFRAEWNDPDDYLGRVGFFWGNGGKYTDYKNLYADFEYTRSKHNTAGNYFPFPRKKYCIRATGLTTPLPFCPGNREGFSLRIPELPFCKWKTFFRK